MDGDNAEEIKAKTEALSQASMKLGEIAYRKAQEEAAQDADNEAPAEGGSDASDDDDAIDADFTDLEIEAEEDDDEQKSA